MGWSHHSFVPMVTMEPCAPDAGHALQRTSAVAMKDSLARHANQLATGITGMKRNADALRLSLKEGAPPFSIQRRRGKEKGRKGDLQDFSIHAIGLCSGSAGCLTTENE